MTTTLNPMQELHGALADLFDAIEGQIRHELTILDPWSGTFADEAWQAVGKTCASAWPRLRELISGSPDLFVLQQVWASRFANRIHCGLLYRAGLSNSGTQNEARRLRAITLGRWASSPAPEGDPRHRDLVTFLMAENPAAAGIPDLGRHTGYRGSIRLRYRVAHVCRQGASLSTVLSVAATQPAATTYQRKIEFSRAVRAASEEGRKWRRIGEQEFALLPRASQLLLLQLPSIWPLTLSQPMIGGSDVEARSYTLMRERDRIEGALTSLMVEIRARRFGRVEKILERIPDTPLARSLCSRLRKESWELRNLTTHLSMREDFGPWVPMPSACFERIQAWAPEKLPAWWAMDAVEFAKRLATGEFDPPTQPRQISIPQQDLAPLRRGWPLETQEALIRGGYGHLLTPSAGGWSSISLPMLFSALSNMPFRAPAILSRRLESLSDARPWLLMMSEGTSSEYIRACRDMAQVAIDTHWRHRWDYGWGRWIVTSYGCEGWERIEDIALQRTTPLKDAVSVFAAGKQPLFPGKFQEVVARSLHKEELLPTKPLNFLKAWLVRDPLAARALAEHAPLAWIERLSRNASTPLQALDVFLTSKNLSAEVKRLAWRNRMSRTQDSRELIRLSVQMPSGIGGFRNLSQWVLEGPVDSQDLGSILMARRDGRRLQELHQALGKERFERACTGAINCLIQIDSDNPTASSSRRRLADASTLELVRCLGGEGARDLIQSLSRCDFGAPSGQKLDSSYRQYSIAKSNGGERVISAPSRSLKRVQRSIVDKLLSPLVLHNAACGFVRGRSILDNAMPHARKAVVVNTDIRNCFSSVRWQLVLGALRREFESRLSPQAIGMLVDLTTSHGALPVGAPSSPALLNLVLRRTDEILQGYAARINASYTRYADDLTFSGGTEVISLLRVAEKSLSRIGLELDPRKTNVFREGRRQTVTGLVVNQIPTVPRVIRRRLRAAVHHVENGKQPHWNGEAQDLSSLRGHLAFLQMVNRIHAQPLQLRLEAALAGREDLQCVGSISEIEKQALRGGQPS